MNWRTLKNNERSAHETEMSTTGLPLTLAITQAMPEMNDDMVHQALGAYYETYVSLGRETTNYNKNKFIQDSKNFITRLKTNPSELANLEAQEK